MSEKIDLAGIARDAEESRGDYFGVSLDVDEVLAIVAAVRAALALRNSGDDADERYGDLCAALAPFTDSSEVNLTKDA